MASLALRPGGIAARPMARPRFRPLPWIVALLIAGLFLGAPLAGFASLLKAGSAAALLTPTQLNALRETALLMAGVAVLAGSMGAVAAWIVALHDFPFRRAIEIALVLPLAFPTYLAAFVAVDLLDFFGPVQSAIRWALGVETRAAYAFFEIRSLPGAMAVMALVLFPYVYVPCRLVFARSGRNVIEAARLLGARGPGLFLRIGLPLARPAIAAGLVLALLETLNDIGATEHLGVSSISVVIRDFWLNRADIPGAARLAGLLLAIVALLLLFDRSQKARRPGPARGAPTPRAVRLTGAKAAGAILLAGLPALFGFVIPAGFLVVRAVQYSGRQALDPDFLHALLASASLGAATALAVAMLAGALAVAVRVVPRLAPAARGTALGYAIPGTVLVLALFPVLGAADDLLAKAGLAFAISGTGIALGFALSIRFLGIGTGQAVLALGRLPVSIDWVARVHGMGDLALAAKVHLPAMAPGLALGAILVFIDAVKELPATLLLRPLNFETLATRAYSAASAGTFEHAALDSLAILALGGIAALMLVRRR